MTANGTNAQCVKLKMYEEYKNRVATQNIQYSGAGK